MVSSALLFLTALDRWPTLVVHLVSVEGVEALTLPTSAEF